MTSLFFSLIRLKKSDFCFVVTQRSLPEKNGLDKLVVRPMFLGEMRKISRDEMNERIRCKDKLGCARKNFASPVGRGQSGKGGKIQ